MSEFIQIHGLFSYPASNPNRDQDGEPKSIMMGNVRRGRISSQCLKRTWRKSPAFAEAFGGKPGTGNLGIRTKELACSVYEDLIAGGVPDSKAESWTMLLGSVFGVVEGPDGEDSNFKNSTLFFASPEERQALSSFVQKIVTEKRDPPVLKGKEALEKEASKIRPEILQQSSRAVDLAMFGRMFAQDKAYSVEAAVQVAHGFSVNPMESEFDFFTAVDDIKESGESDETRGSGHMGESGLGSGVYYAYVSINRTMLEKTLGDAALAGKACRALAEAVFTQAPSGKANSSAHQGVAIYGRVERGTVAPRNLSLAFLEPIKGTNVWVEAAKKLRNVAASIDKIYGPRCAEIKEFEVYAGEGSLAELLDLAGR